MAYSSKNKEKIKYFKEHPEIVYEEYIVNGKSNAQLTKEWELPKSTVHEIIRCAGLVGIKLSKKLTTCDESLFDINNPVFCYMAGLISADGYIDEKNHRVSLRMTEPAKEVLEKLRDYFSVSNEVAMYKGRGFKGELEMYDLTISSKTLLEKLRELNIHGRKKDLLVRFPDMRLLDDECREMYMRGLWDGDGTIRSNGVSSIFQQSKLMIDAIMEFISSLDIIDNIKCSERYRDGYLIGYDIYFRSRDFYDWLYRSNLDFKIESKYLRQFG